MDQNISEVNESSNNMETDIKDDEQTEQSNPNEMQVSGVSEEKNSAVIMDVNCQELPKFQPISSVHHESLKEIEKSKLVNLQNEISDLKGKLIAQEMTFKETESQIKAEFFSSIEKLSRERDALQKQKEDMENKYANSEKQLIVERKVQLDMVKRVRMLKKERKSLGLKLNDAIAKNGKLAADVESQVIKIAKLQEENEKLNVDFVSKERSVRRLDNELLAEISNHEEVTGKLKNAVSAIEKMVAIAQKEYEICQREQQFLENFPIPSMASRPPVPNFIEMTADYEGVDSSDQED